MVIYMTYEEDMTVQKKSGNMTVQGTKTKKQGKRSNFMINA